MLERGFLLRFARTLLEIGSGLALNVGATFLTDGQTPLGIIMVGAAASLLAAKSTADHQLNAVERRSAEDELTALINKHGTLRAAVSAIADGREAHNGTLSRERAAELLQLVQQDQQAPTSEATNEALLLHIGRWIEQWCLSHGQAVDDFRKQVDALCSQIQTTLDSIESKIERVAQEGQHSNDLVQQLVRRVRPFVDADTYFRPLLDPGRLFRHDWTLVGREVVLAELADFVTSGPELIGLLVGRGGIGKSRLLLALSHRLRELSWPGSIYVAPEQLSLAGLLEDDLPDHRGLLIIDDAHRYDEIAALMQIIHLHRPSLRVLLATRPHAIDYLRSTAVAVQYDLTQIRVFAEIKALRKADAKALAEQALGETYKHLGEQLIETTGDSPLVTVVAGQLVSRDAVAPELLERKVTFRNTILDRFQDELLGQIDGSVPPTDCRALLEVLAAVAPAPVHATQFVSAVSAFTALSEDRIRVAITALLRAGVLLERGSTARITPDVLADHILHNACFRDGNETGFATKAYSHFFEGFPTQVLKNLAELDWRVQQTHEVAPQLLDRIWAEIAEDYKTAPYDRQRALLQVLSEIAYLQPAQVLSLVEFSIRDTAKTPVDEGASRNYVTTAEHVRQALPGVLRHVGYRLDYLPRVCDLLWSLGADDARNTNPIPDHPIRILEDVATYQLKKPLAAHDILLQAALRWLREPGAHDHIHSVFDVLDPLIAKTGYSSTSDRHAVTYHPFFIDIDNTRHLRSAVFEQLQVAAASGAPRTRHRALTSLSNFLLPPVGYFGMPVPPEAAQEWEPAQRGILAFLINLFESATDPVQRLQIIAAVPYYVRHHAGPDAKAATSKLKHALDDDESLHLLRALVQGGSLDIDDDDDDAKDWAARSERKEAQLAALAQRLVRQYPEPEALFAVLNDSIQRLTQAGMTTDTWDVLRSIGKTDAKYGLALARLACGSPECPIFSRVDVLVGLYRQVDQIGASDFAEELSRSEDPRLRWASSMYLRGWGWTSQIEDAELQILLRLIRDKDSGTSDNALSALMTVRNSQPRIAIDLALSADVCHRESGAKRMCEVLMKDYRELHAEVNRQDLVVAIGHLVTIPALNDHRIIRFILAASTVVPELVAQFTGADIGLRSNHHIDLPLRSPHMSRLVPATTQCGFRLCIVSFGLRIRQGGQLSR